MAQATNVNYFGQNSLAHLWEKIKAQDSSLWTKVQSEDSSLWAKVQEEDSSLWAKIPVKGVKLDGSLLTPDGDAVVDIVISGNYVSRADFDASLAAVDGSIGDLKTEDSSLETAIGKLVTEDASLETAISGLVTEDSSLETAIGKLVTEDASLESAVSVLKSKDEDIDSSITALKDKDTQIDASLAALVAKDKEIDSSIVRLDGRIDALGAALKYKGSKATYEELPTEGNEEGDVWNVIAAHGNYPAGTNYAWTGSEWDPLGGAIDTSAWLTNENMVEITNSYIDSVCI